jgi:creatinine amidohydrolase
VWVAPSLPYAVTEYAQGFCGAISIESTLYQQLLCTLARQYQAAGFGLICWINHHLEPEQLAAIGQAAHDLNSHEQSVNVIAPSVVSRRWGRSLGDEFKSGACHAGSYEGSMILVTRPDLVRQRVAADLPALDISLSKAIKDGKSGFIDAGMTRAYTGAPALATSEEGERLYIEHTHMVVTEVLEALGR